MKPDLNTQILVIVLEALLYAADASQKIKELWKKKKLKK